MTELTILMPCLNEEKTLAFCICEAKKYISESGISAEILIADNGSTDRSPKLPVNVGRGLYRLQKKATATHLSAE